MRIVRTEKETRQERALREIRARRTGENVAHGEGEIDNTPTANILPTDDILSRSFRLTDEEA
jgi:hypothetical protein